MALLKLNHLKNKYDLEISKIAHVGAHKGQEVDEYINIFPEVMIHLFEPQVNLFEYLTENFKNFNFFDENIFLYLENDDFCKRLIDNNENIYIVPDSKIKHIGASSVDKKYYFQIEISRNWHWIWSKFYFNKKHKGFIFAFLTGFPSFSSALFKSLIPGACSPK